MIGIVALIFLGPRRLPEIARKAGKIMSELRGTANEFKQTWEKEVDFEEETKALKIDNLLDEADEGKPVGKENSILSDARESTPIEVPAITAMNKDNFDTMWAAPSEPKKGNHETDSGEPHPVGEIRPLGGLPREHVHRRGGRRRRERKAHQRAEADELPLPCADFQPRSEILPRPASAAGRIRLLSPCMPDLARSSQHAADGSDDRAQQRGQDGPERRPRDRGRGPPPA